MMTRLAAVTTERRSTGELLGHALAGDAAAWQVLVDRLSPAVWSATRAYRLSEANAADVFQTVWLRLLDRHETIRNPEALAGWIATTARNEALALIRRNSRSQPLGELPEVDLDPSNQPDAQVEASAVSDLLWAGFNELGEICQRLLRLLAEKVPYKVIAVLIDRPIGSLGQMRKDCLTQLRATKPVAQML